MLLKPKTKFDGKVLTVYLSGDIDHHSARKIREYTDALIGEMKPVMLLLDFSAVTFMDSSGVGLIMGRYRIMKLYGGSVRAVSIPPALRKMMELSGLGCLDVLERGYEKNESA